jgi:hypothetical protein
LGTTGITAVGLSKFSDVFPLPSTPSSEQVVAIAFLIGGLAAMAGVVMWFTARLWKVSSPIFMNLKACEISDASATEQTVIEQIYKDAANLNDATSFELYARRGLRLQRVAQRTPNVDVGKLAAAEAKQINADVIATQARAATNVVRKRAQDAIIGDKSLRMVALFVAGLLGFGLAADYLESERAGRVASAKSCAEAITAIRTAYPATPKPLPAKLLPHLCGGRAAVPVAAAAAAATPDTQVSGAVKDLATRYDACVTAAKEDATTKCADIKKAMSAMVPQ